MVHQSRQAATNVTSMVKNGYGVPTQIKAYGASNVGISLHECTDDGHFGLVVFVFLSQ